MKEHQSPLAGLVDLHFHGAYGIDLVTANESRLFDLASRLAQDGVAGFCPTTLSLPKRELRGVVERLGQWIRLAERIPEIACPLGIHLEGPYLSPGACGAHPPGAIRRVDFDELESLWRVSLERLRILTVAPERLSRAELPRLAEWCKTRKIRLSLGHSQADEETAQKAFQAGFSGVTHAWNALPFHQRAPGALGAAIGRPGVYLELIPDGVHVAPTVVAWTRSLHSSICFVSDCVPAGGTKSGLHSFGPLKIRRKDGACRLPNGALAGGGDPLSDTYRAWIRREVLRIKGKTVKEIIRETFPLVSTEPLKALGIPVSRLNKRPIRWAF